MLMGWASDEEYVKFMVPRLGYCCVAQALGMTPDKLRERWPGLHDGRKQRHNVEYSANSGAAYKRKYRERKRVGDA